MRLFCVSRNSNPGQTVKRRGNATICTDFENRYLQEQELLMNNNLYHWHNERMVDMEMQQVRHELAQANYFRQSGSAERSWLARALGGLLKLFNNRSEQAGRSADGQPGPSCKYNTTH
jgi:hypothetical protein